MLILDYKYKPIKGNELVYIVLIVIRNIF